MHIGIDAREALSQNRRGKAQWAFRAIEALLDRSDIRCTLFGSTDAPSEWKEKPAFENIVQLQSKGLWWHRNVSRLLRHGDTPDVYLSPTSFIVPYLLAKHVRCVPVVHDLIAFEQHPHNQKARLVERLTLPKALQTASAVCCVSDTTANAVEARFGKTAQLFTVRAGPTWTDPRSWRGSGNHILSIGTLCPRKNQLRLIKAFEKLPKDIRLSYRLVLVGGRGWEDDEIITKAKNTHGVEWLGYRSDDECKKLLETCTAFVSVSEAEGFNLPVLDALTAGAPLLASDIPTTREVAGDEAAILVNPLSVEDIAQGLALVLTDTARERRQQAGFGRAGLFSWQNTASRIVEACQHR